MNISKVSTPIVINKKPCPLKAGIVTTAVATTAFLINDNQNEHKNGPFKNFITGTKTLIDRIIYIKNNHAKKDSAYHGEMLNPVLNDMVAQLNDNVYKNMAQEVNGFKPICVKEDKRTGFGAVAHRQDNEIFITYRGTNNLGCLKSDWQMMLGKLPEQFKLADKFYQEIKKNNPDCDITLVGHSLGGSLAQLVASKYKDVPAITLNAFGTDTIMKRNDKQFKNNNNVYNYIINGDIVSNSSKQVGETVMLDRTYVKNKHDMPNYLNRWA